MAAPVKPETEQESQQYQNNSQGPENSTPTENQAQNSQPTQSTESRADRLLGLYEQQMRESHRRASELEQELRRRDDEARQREQNTPPSVPDVNPTEFWNKPLPHIAQIIREETRKAVQPLYEFKTQIENQNKYEMVKNRFKVDPRYRDIFPKIEGIVDQLMLQSGAEPSDNMMNATILSAIGALHTGQIPGVTLDTPTTNAPANLNQPENNTNAATNQQGNRPVITPAHLRPNPVSQNLGGDQKPKLRELTELEARIARENSMTKEEYLNWMDEDPTKVAHSKIGKVTQVQNPDSQVVRGTNNPGGGR
jgi:hypothetical protein